MMQPHFLCNSLNYGKLTVRKFFNVTGFCYLRVRNKADKNMKKIVIIIIAILACINANAQSFGMKNGWDFGWSEKHEHFYSKGSFASGIGLLYEPKQNTLELYSPISGEQFVLRVENIGNSKKNFMGYLDVETEFYDGNGKLVEKKVITFLTPVGKNVKTTKIISCNNKDTEKLMYYVRYLGNVKMTMKTQSGDYTMTVQCQNPDFAKKDGLTLLKEIRNDFFAQN